MTALSETYPDLLAWVGEDELGSGKIGIKEHRDRMDKERKGFASVDEWLERLRASA